MARDTHSKTLLVKENTGKSSLLDTHMLENYVANSQSIKNIYNPITYLHSNTEKENLTAMSNVKRNVLFPDNKGSCLSDMENDALVLNVNSSSVSEGREIKNLQHALKYNSTDENVQDNENKISASVAKLGLQYQEKHFLNIFNDMKKKLPCEFAENVIFDVNYPIPNGPLKQDINVPFIQRCSTQELSKIRKPGDGISSIDTSNKTWISSIDTSNKTLTTDHKELFCGTNLSAFGTQSVLNDNQVSQCNGYTENTETFAMNKNCVQIELQGDNSSLEVSRNPVKENGRNLFKSIKDCQPGNSRNAAVKIVKRMNKSIFLSNPFAKKKLKICSNSFISSNRITKRKTKNMFRRINYMIPFRPKISNIIAEHCARERIMPQLIPLSVPSAVNGAKESPEDEVICVPDSPEMPILIPFTSESEELPQIPTKDMEQLVSVVPYVSPDLAHESECCDEVEPISKDLHCVTEKQDWQRCIIKDEPDIPDNNHARSLKRGLQPKVVLRRLCLENYKPCTDKKYSSNGEDYKLPESSPSENCRIDLKEFLQETIEPEIDVIDGQNFFSFHSKQHMELFSDKHGLTLPCPSGMEDFHCQNLEEVQEGMIIPTKTKDITQIKGWRNKFFAPEIHIAGIKNDVENSVASVDSTFSDESFVETAVDKSSKNHLTLGTLVPDSSTSFEEKVKDKGTKSAFVSDSLEYFLQNESKLQVSLLKKMNPNISPIPENASILSVGNLRKSDHPSILLKRMKILPSVSSDNQKFSDTRENILTCNEDIDISTIDDTSVSTVNDALIEDPFSDDDKIPLSQICKLTSLGNGKSTKKNKQKNLDSGSLNSHRLVLRLKKQVSGSKDDYKVTDVSHNGEDRSNNVDVYGEQVLKNEDGNRVIERELEVDASGLTLIKRTMFSSKNDTRLLKEFLRNLNRCGEMKDLDAMLIKSNQTYISCPLITDNRALKAISACPQASKGRCVKKTNLKYPHDKNIANSKPKQKNDNAQYSVGKYQLIQKKTSKVDSCSSSEPFASKTSESRGKRCIRLPARYLDSAVMVAGSEWVSPTSDYIDEDMNKKSKKRKIEIPTDLDCSDMFLYGNNKNLPSLFPNATWSASDTVNSDVRGEISLDSFVNEQDSYDKRTLSPSCARTTVYKSPRKKLICDNQAACNDLHVDKGCCRQKFNSRHESSQYCSSKHLHNVGSRAITKTNFDASKSESGSVLNSTAQVIQDFPLGLSGSKSVDHKSSITPACGIPLKNVSLEVQQNHKIHSGSDCSVNTSKSTSLLGYHRIPNIVLAKRNMISNGSGKTVGGNICKVQDKGNTGNICQETKKPTYNSEVTNSLNLRNINSEIPDNEFSFVGHLPVTEREQDLLSLNFNVSEKNKVAYYVLPGKSPRKMPEGHTLKQDVTPTKILRKISFSSPDKNVVENNISPNTSPEGSSKRKNQLPLKPLSFENVSINGNLPSNVHSVQQDYLLNKDKKICSKVPLFSESPTLKASDCSPVENKTFDCNALKNKSQLLCTMSSERYIQAFKQPSCVQPFSVKQITGLKKNNFSPGIQLTALKFNGKILFYSPVARNRECDSQKISVQNAVGISNQKAKISVPNKQELTHVASKAVPSDRHILKSHSFNINRSAGPTLVTLSPIDKSEVNMSKETIEIETSSLNKQIASQESEPQASIPSLIGLSDVSSSSKNSIGTALNKEICLNHQSKVHKVSVKNSVTLKNQELIKLSRSTELSQSLMCDAENKEKEIIDPLSLPETKVVSDHPLKLIEEDQNLVDIETVEKDYNFLQVLKNSEQYCHDQNFSENSNCSSQVVDLSRTDIKNNLEIEPLDEHYHSIHVLRPVHNLNKGNGHVPENSANFDQNCLPSFKCISIDLDSSDESESPGSSITSEKEVERQQPMDEAAEYLRRSVPQLSRCNSVQDLVLQAEKLVKARQRRSLYMKQTIMHLLQKRERLFMYYKTLALELPPKERKKNAAEMLKKIRSGVTCANLKEFPRLFEENYTILKSVLPGNQRLQKTTRAGNMAQSAVAAKRQLSEEKEHTQVIDITDSDDDQDYNATYYGLKAPVTDNINGNLDFNETEKLNPLNHSSENNKNLLQRVNTAGKSVKGRPGIIRLSNIPQVKEYLQRTNRQISIGTFVHSLPSEQGVKSVLCQENTLQCVDSDEAQKSSSETGKKRLKYSYELLTNNCASQDLGKYSESTKDEYLKSTSDEISSCLKSQQYPSFSKNADSVSDACNVINLSYDDAEAESAKIEIPSVVPLDSNPHSSSCVLRTISVNDGRAASYIHQSKDDPCSTQTVTIRKRLCSPPVNCLHRNSYSNNVTDSATASDTVSVVLDTMERSNNAAGSLADSALVRNSDICHHRKELHYGCSDMEKKSICKTVSPSESSACDNTDMWVSTDTGEQCIVTRIDSDNEEMDDSCVDNLQDSGAELVFPTIVSCSTISEKTFYGDADEDAKAC